MATESADILFYENCPLCDTKLEAITNDNGYVIDWFCNKCATHWSLEDLEYEPIQRSIDKWIF
jgi:hypothetical protein